MPELTLAFQTRGLLLFCLLHLVGIDFFFLKLTLTENPGCILSQCVYAEHIMRNAGLDEAQAGIKIAGRNINNLTYSDDSTLTVEK